MEDIKKTRKTNISKEQLIKNLMTLTKENNKVLFMRFMLDGASPTDYTQEELLVLEEKLLDCIEFPNKYTYLSHQIEASFNKSLKKQNQTYERQRNFKVEYVTVVIAESKIISIKITSSFYENGEISVKAYLESTSGTKEYLKCDITEAFFMPDGYFTIIDVQRSDVFNHIENGYNILHVYVNNKKVFRSKVAKTNAFAFNKSAKKLYVPYLDEENYDILDMKSKKIHEEDINEEVVLVQYHVYKRSQLVYHIKTGIKDISKLLEFKLLREKESVITIKYNYEGKISGELILSCSIWGYGPPYEDLSVERIDGNTKGKIDIEESSISGNYIYLVFKDADSNMFNKSWEI